MSLRTRTRKLAVTMGAVGIVSGALALGAAGPAAAATQHYFKICAYGNYDSEVSIPQQHESSFIAQPGVSGRVCQQLTILPGSTYGNIWAIEADGSRTYITTVGLSSTSNWSGATYGTLSNFTWGYI